MNPDDDVSMTAGALRTLVYNTRDTIERELLGSMRKNEGMPSVISVGLLSAVTFVLNEVGGFLGKVEHPPIPLPELVKEKTRFPGEKSKPAPASKHRHEFDQEGGTRCDCGAPKGKRGRPAKVAAPVAAVVSAALPGVVEPEYVAPAVPAVSLAGDAAADKYADGNNGGSARR